MTVIFFLMCNYCRNCTAKLLAVRNCEVPRNEPGTHIVTHDKWPLPSLEKINTRHRISVSELVGEDTRRELD